jgi:dihydrodipicolinate synthase/N-acetylneuraminate lyase
MSHLEARRETAGAPPILWRGIIPPLVTPLQGRDELDVAGLERLTEHILAGGVHGLFVLGSTGEAPSLSARLQRDVTERTIRLVRNRVPVLVGITNTSFTDSVNLARFAADCGAAAVVLAPPYYFPADQPELVEYIGHLMATLPLPLFLYNMPGFTKVSLDPETVLTLAEHPGIAGLKDSSGSMIYFHRLQDELRSRRPDFALFVGPEELLGEAVLLGASGGVCGGANLWPRLYVDLYAAAVAGGQRRVADLHAKVMWISGRIYGVGRHPSRYLKGLKCALHGLGLCNDFMAEPFHKFRAEERRRIEGYLREMTQMGWIAGGALGESLTNP